MEYKQKVVSLPLFYSYAHEDELLREELEKHLRLLSRQGFISEWHDRRIVAGMEWAREIDAHLESATLILLLISPDFLASDYCYDVEMQRALERHAQNEVRVIPIILRPCDWQNAPLAHLQALPHDGRAVTEWGNQDVAFRDIARGIRTTIEEFLSTSTPLQPLPTVASAPAKVGVLIPTVPTDRNRQRMLKRVHMTWIAGVLEQSLHNAALIALGLEKKAEVLNNPWRLLMQEVDRPTQRLPEGTRITQVYDATEGGLLILGEPGAGKTTLLLELARDLIERAQSNENAPIPVVFNLSSWAKKRLGLSDWLIEELSIRYEVPRRLGKSWISENRLLLLLDGLDEVAPGARKQCIEAINSYRQTHLDIQIVICSRSTEYLNARTQLRLQSAVVVQSLTQEQIEAYLESAGERAEALREALHQDADIRELATTPLMLTILLFVYGEASPTEISEVTSLEIKQKRIFAAYVQGMLKRRGVLKRYKPEQIMCWLAYLARQMKRQNQTIFYIEQMQPDWLPKRWQRFGYRALVGALLGGLLGDPVILAASLMLESLFNFLSYTVYSVIPIYWPIIGLVIGLFIGLLYPKSTEVRTAEVISWSWAKVRWAFAISTLSGSIGLLTATLISESETISYGIPPLLYLLITILMGGILSVLSTKFSRRNTRQYTRTMSSQGIWHAIWRGTLLGLITVSFDLFILFINRSLYISSFYLYIYSVIVACVSGFLVSLFYGVSTSQLETRNSFKPNQGIWRSAYNGGRVWLLFFVFITVLFFGISLVLLSIGNPYEDFFQNALYLIFILIIEGGVVGFFIGAFFGLLNGGIACIKHILLRLFLWRTRFIPLNYTHFLDYAAERILLRKVGGGYIFIHRLLLDYFADKGSEKSLGTSRTN